MASTIRMPAQEEAAGRFGPQDLYRPAQAFAVSGRHGGKRRAVRARLAKWQIAAQDHKSAIRKCISQGDQEFTLAICAGSVAEHQRIAIGLRGFMEKAMDRRFRREI